MQPAPMGSPPPSGIGVPPEFEEGTIIIAPDPNAVFVVKDEEDN